MRTISGRAALAAAIKNQALHIAWGLGDGVWTEPPAPDDEAVALIDEVGRRRVTYSNYLVEDEDGDIEIVDVGTFSVSVEPTRTLHVVTRFDFDDAPADEIREIGLFVGTTVDTELPPGQRYFVPAEVVDQGSLLELVNIAAIVRSAAKRETIEFLLVF